MIDLGVDSREFFYPLLEAMASTGWRLEKLPDAGNLPRNRLQLVLKRRGAEDRFRVLAYTIGESGRSQPDERRVEITSTYEGGGLSRLTGYRDVVIGYDPDSEVFVGLDPRRLRFGGRTQNASTFVSLSGMQRARAGPRLHVLTRPSRLFGQEHQAYGEPKVFDEYLLNLRAIHARGISFGRRPSKRPPRLCVRDSDAVGSEVVLSLPTIKSQPRPPRKADVVAYEEGGEERLRRRRIDPATFADVKKRCEENGELGEDLVMRKEQLRLSRAGRVDLAQKVKWVSRESIGEGYDIESFEADNSPRYVEVKSTEGTGRVFPMSANEWRVAEAEGERYHIARVTAVRDSPNIEYLTDPCQLEREGLLTRSAAGGWRIEAQGP